MQVTALRYGAPLVVDVDTNAFAEAVARHFSVSQAEFEAAAAAAASVERHGAPPASRYALKKHCKEFRVTKRYLQTGEIPVKGKRAKATATEKGKGMGKKKAMGECTAEKKCSVCLDPFKPSQAAIKLPCGHTFHKGCAMRWLRKHCTCPLCRFELPTSNAMYELGRRARMQRRVEALEQRREARRLAEAAKKKKQKQTKSEVNENETKEEVVPGKATKRSYRARGRRRRPRRNSAPGM